MSKLHHVLILILVFATSCSRDTESPASTDAIPEGAQWLLAGDEDERFARVAKHLRGFDVAMVETGYRYEELYWAGQDHNWGYASYQLDKIATAVANGVERRPKRAGSARMLDGALEQVRGAVDRRDPAAFDTTFAALTQTCNACHEAERVPFAHVEPPTLRVSPVRSPPADGGV